MKKFTMIVTVDDKTVNINGENHGFNAMEIVGFLEAKKQDILNQMNNPKKYTFTRAVEKDGELLIKEEEKEDERRA